MSRIMKYSGALFLSAALIAGVYGGYNFLAGNFHVVTIGEAYRSAQLDKDGLAGKVDEYGIKSVLNLRGKETGSPWYIDELALCESRGIAHYDITLSALSEPTEGDVKDMIEIFKTAPRPILMHCLGGADRSGLAAAVWKRVIDKEPKALAARQLSLWYGHLPFGKTSVMDKRFARID